MIIWLGSDGRTCKIYNTNSLTEGPTHNIYVDNEQGFITELQTTYVNYNTDIAETMESLKNIPDEPPVFLKINKSKRYVVKQMVKPVTVLINRRHFSRGLLPKPQRCYPKITERGNERHRPDSGSD